MYTLTWQVWTLPKNEVRLVARDVPLTPVRVASVFAEKGATTEAPSDDIPEGEPFFLDRKRENVEQEVETTDGNNYYEQLKTAAGWFKLGRSLSTCHYHSVVIWLMPLILNSKINAKSYFIVKTKIVHHFFCVLLGSVCACIAWCVLMLYNTTGDHVYVRSDEDRPYVARIDKMWMDNG